jgi:hypothetical protein
MPKTAGFEQKTGKKSPLRAEKGMELCEEGI